MPDVGAELLHVLVHARHHRLHPLVLRVENVLAAGAAPQVSACVLFVLVKQVNCVPVGRDVVGLERRQPVALGFLHLRLLPTLALPVVVCTSFSTYSGSLKALFRRPEGSIKAR